MRFGARDYAPTLGRWIAKDLVLFGGGLANIYEYAGEDPLNAIDNNGMKVIFGATGSRTRDAVNDFAHSPCGSATYKALDDSPIVFYVYDGRYTDPYKGKPIPGHTSVPLSTSENGPRGYNEYVEILFDWAAVDIAAREYDNPRTPIELVAHEFWHASGALNHGGLLFSGEEKANRFGVCCQHNCCLNKTGRDQ